jgi:ankyrin repeat protein
MKRFLLLVHGALLVSSIVFSPSRAMHASRPLAFTGRPTASANRSLLRPHLFSSEIRNTQGNALLQPLRLVRSFPTNPTRSTPEGRADKYRKLISALRRLQEREGQPLLLEALEQGQTERAQMLIDAGVSGDITNSKGETALHLAAREGNLQLVRHLLNQINERHGYKALEDYINRANQDGNTPLHYAALYPTEQAAEIACALAINGASCRCLEVPPKDLIKNASTRARNIQKRTPLEEAVRSGNKPVAELLTMMQREEELGNPRHMMFELAVSGGVVGLWILLCLLDGGDSGL